MTSKRKKVLIIAAAAVVVAAAAVLTVFMNTGYYLVLTNWKTETEYAAYPVSDGDRFSVEFIHSVNKSPVKDIYEIRDNVSIYVVETDYYDFGAGVQTQLNPGETLEYGDDGSMRVKNIDTLIPRLIYIVGTVSDHTMEIGSRSLSLRELCGKNSQVLFTVEKRIFGRLKV